MDRADLLILATVSIVGIVLYVFCVMFVEPRYKADQKPWDREATPWRNWRDE